VGAVSALAQDARVELLPLNEVPNDDSCGEPDYHQQDSNG